MSKRDVLCAGGCGGYTWSGAGSRPPGQAICQPCRRAARIPPACEVCGAQYRPTYGNQRTCGRACGAVLQARNRAPRPARAPVERPPRVVACRECGRDFQVDSRTGAICSEACRRKRKQRSDARHNRARLRAQWDRSERTCPKCNVAFSPAHVAAKYCSTLCAQSAKRARERACGTRDVGKNHRKRARHYGRQYEPIRARDIFDRDGWVCQICGKRVLKGKKAPHPLSPSLDHVIPMSEEGGDHVPSNVRLAHFLCNSLRGTGGCDQLALIG